MARLLIRAGIARGLSQKSLASRLGLKEQQIQRYEASEYASASLARIRSVAGWFGGNGWPDVEARAGTYAQATSHRVG